MGLPILFTSITDGELDERVRQILQVGFCSTIRGHV